MRASLSAAILMVCSPFLCAATATIPSLDDAPPTTSECLKTCYDTYLDAVKDCKTGECLECVVSVGGICILYELDDACYQDCVGAAGEALTACIADCK